MSKRIDLYVDIETLPTADEAVVASLRVAAPNIEPKGAPANLKDPAKIEEARAANVAKAAAEQIEANEKAIKDSAEAVAKTALDGAYGRIAIIGWAKDDGESSAWTACDNGSTYDGEFNEAGLLRDFFSEFDDDANIRIVGHNVIGFDLRFLVQRAAVLGVKIPRWLPIDPKPWAENVVDTMIAWSGTRDRISLDRLCRALGVPGKMAGVDGSKFAELWASDPAKAVEYCRADVEATRAVHMKLAASLYNVA